MPCAGADPAPSSDEGILKQIQLINQIPEDQLNDKSDPGFSLLRALYDQDGPDFLTLRKLLGKADVRSGLNPSARCLLAGVISQRSTRRTSARDVRASFWSPAKRAASAMSQARRMALASCSLKATSGSDRRSLGSIA